MPPYLLEDVIASYTLYAKAEGHSQKTIDEKIRNVREFCHFLNRDDITTITVGDLQRYLVYLRDKKLWSGTDYAKERPLSATSINTYFRSIRSFWNYLVKEKIIPPSPISTMAAPKKGKPLPKVLPEDELCKVLQTASDNPLEAALVAVLADSGIRLAELVGLTLDHIDIALCRCRVTGKGNKERCTYFSEQTAAILKEYFSWRDNNGAII